MLGYFGTLCGCGVCCDSDTCTVVCVACVYAERVRGCDSKTLNVGRCKARVDE